MKAHMLSNDGTIINTIVVNSLNDLPGVTLVDASSGGDIGDRYIDGVITKASHTEEIPQSVTMRQARLALFAAGLLPSVETAINNLPEPAKTAALIEWNYSSEVQRNKGLVLQMGTALGLTSQQLDQLFITASKIE